MPFAGEGQTTSKPWTPPSLICVPGPGAGITEQDAARLDVEFHDAIFRAAHYDRLYTSWSAIWMQVYWFLCSRNIVNADWRVATVAGHQEILDLIRAGKEKPATSAIRLHISSAYSRIIAQRTAEDTESSDTAEMMRVAKSFMLR